MGNLYKLVYIFILLYNYTSLIFVDGLLEVVTDANVIIFNETHLKLNWTYPGTEKEVGFNILKSAVENVIINNKTVQNGTFYSNKTEYYDEYSEGVRYEYRIESCSNTTNCKFSKNIFINTPINLNLNITGCTENKFNYLDSKKIIQGNTFICLSTNPLLTNDEICNNSMYPNQEKDKLKPCNTTGNEMSCNANYTIYGFVRNPTSDNNYTLIFNLTKVSENLTITTVTTKNSNGSVEESSSSTLLIVIIVLIIIILITVLGIIFYLKKYKNTKEDIEITEIETEMAPLTKPKPSKLTRIAKSFRYINSKPLSLEELHNLLHNYNQSKDNLSKEYESIVKNIPEKFTKMQNRSSIILPDNNNRIKLDQYEACINASYINGFNRCNKYIATQNPINSKIDDFWAMVWQEKVEAIVMITGLEKKNKEPDTSKKYDQNLEIIKIKTTQQVGFLIKEFELRKQDELRSIKQLHFTSWGDYEVPYNPHIMINFMKYFRKQKFRTPIVVHCSSGVGRTGSFILCDYLMDQAELNQPIDIISGLIHLRKCRNGMINKPMQYKLIHCIMLEYLTNMERSIPILNFKNNIKTYLTENHCLDDIKFINNSQYWINILFNELPHHSYNANKSKTKNILSCKGFVENDKFNYINANKINNFFEDKSFISTQNPLHNTVDDFWNMIIDENTDLIIVLQTLGPNNNNPIFWNQLKKISYKEYSGYQQTMVELINKGKIKILYFLNWSDDEYPDEEIFLNFVLDTMKTECRNITITCHNGGSACGIYLALIKIIEQIKLEHIVDMCSVVRTLRLYRSDFMTDAKQFLYVYKLIRKYLHMDISPLYHSLLYTDVL